MTPGLQQAEQALHRCGNYQTAEMEDVSDPDLIFDLYDKLRAGGIFLWQEVEQFCAAYLIKSKSNAAIANICKPAVDRWKVRYKSAIEAYKEAGIIFERTGKTGDAVLIANADSSFKACRKEKDGLEIFKKHLGSFVRLYEFMSQTVEYDDRNLERLCLYARNLRPMLREELLDEDGIDLQGIVLSHYRLSKIHQQSLKLQENSPDYQLNPGDGLGSAKARDRKEELISQIIHRLNELFITDELTDNDLVNLCLHHPRQGPGEQHLRHMPRSGRQQEPTSTEQFRSFSLPFSLS